MKSLALLKGEYCYEEIFICISKGNLNIKPINVTKIHYQIALKLNLPLVYFCPDSAVCENVEAALTVLTADISSTILGHLLSCKVASSLLLSKTTLVFI